MTWLLGYLLIGFVLHFLGSQVWKVPPNESTWWELAAVALWPLTTIIIAASKIAAVNRWLRRHVSHWINPL